MYKGQASWRRGYMSKCWYEEKSTCHKLWGWETVGTSDQHQRQNQLGRFKEEKESPGWLD